MPRPSCSRVLAAPLLALALAGLTPSAFAGQYYVNSATGSDGNLGTSPGKAFKTVRKALTVATLPNDMIRLAPGDYSQATGELFPLSVGATRIVGEGGAEVTRILGSGDDLLIDARNPDDPAGSVFTLDGVSLVGGRTGVRLNSHAHLFAVALGEVTISGMSQDGIECHADATGGDEGQTSLFLTSVRITDCLRGISIDSTSPTLPSSVSIYASRFERNGIGLNLSAFGGDVTAQATLSRFEDQTLVGVRGIAISGGRAALDLSGCLIARNAVGVELGSFSSQSELSLRTCTITGSSEVGVRTNDMPDPPTATTLVDTIVWGNADDLALDGPLDAQFSLAGDGDLGTRNGNLAADPLFRNAAAGDYRLSWGSPAIESGSPSNPFGLSQDLAGTVRPSDGNLDAVAASDLGCLEFAALDLLGTPSGALIVELAPGELLRIESWGPAGSSTQLLLSLGGFTGCPVPTGFGSFFLNPFQFASLLTLASGPTTPGVLQATIPLAPSLLGFEFSFQGLTTSVLAPKGRALTNPVQFAVRN